MRELKKEGEIEFDEGKTARRGNGEDLAEAGFGKTRPLLMLDIDGVLSLFGFPPHDLPVGRFHAIEGVPHFLSAAAAPQLQRLSRVFDLVWASGWEERANDHLPALLGLPSPLPFLTFERQATAGGSMRAHWKLHAIDSYAGSRPLAWVDDAFNDACERWAAQREASTLLIATEPAVGLTEPQTDRLIAWASTRSA
jgi:HAD domain in Swiss Army Knife RNA repair proteins